MRLNANQRTQQMTYILEALEKLRTAIVAQNTIEIERLLNLPIADIALVSDNSSNLRDLLIGTGNDPDGIVIDDWNRTPYKTVDECFCRIYEVFAIDDDLPIEGK